MQMAKSPTGFSGPQKVNTMAEIAPHIKFIREKGRSLSDIHWNTFAFTRTDALALIQLLKKTDVVIYGGDGFRIQDGVLTHDYATWSFNELGLALDERKKASCSRAEAYIKAYPDPEDGSVLYSFVLSDRSARDPDFPEDLRWFEKGGNYQNPDIPDR
jgi:hypothetical protein